MTELEKFEKGLKKQRRQSEYTICAAAVTVIAEMCSISGDKVIDLLTNWAWTKKEADGIKKLRKP